jgi:hypothetical protein
LGFDVDLLRGGVEGNLQKGQTMIWEGLTRN